MEKYVLFIPMGGFNDILVGLGTCIDYCKQYNRTLLFAMKLSCYDIELGDYFELEDMGVRILYDTAEIKRRLSNKTVYHVQIDLTQLIDGHIRTFKWCSRDVYKYNDALCDLPEKVVEEDIILHVRCGNGLGFNLFKHFIWKDDLKEHCLQKMTLKNYLCIQVRCTDHRCDYSQLYEENKSLIHSYPEIYLATDNAEVVQYFKSKGLNLFCYTTFPRDNYPNLHCSNVDPRTRFCDLMVDICMATGSDQILSNSRGNFIRLLRDCFANKAILNKLKN